MAPGSGWEGREFGRSSVRGRIVRAAFEEVLAADAGDSLAFLTPGVLADVTRDPGRTWSAGTVRYQFRRDGLAFDRDALAVELADEALERANRWFDDWGSRAVLDIVAAGIGGRTGADALSAALRELAVATGEWARERILGVSLMVGLIVLERPSGATASGLFECVEVWGRRFALSCAEVDERQLPDETLLAQLGASAILRALMLGLTCPRAGSDEAIDAVAHTLMEGLGPVDSRGITRVGGHETADEVVVRAERALDAVGVSSPLAPALVEQLATGLPASSWAFAHGRRRLEALLEQPELQRTQRGQKMWRVAAEVLSMADGNRELADEVATVGLLDARPDPGLAGVRTGWLLLRLERFEEAELYLERVRRQARRSGDEDAFALAEAFAAYGACLTGPLERAVALAATVRELVPAGAAGDLAIAIADAADARALLLVGDDAGASKVLEGAGDGASADPSLGTTMLQISRAWHLLATGRPRRALDELRAVRERLRRLHVRNPAGWPWLEPAVEALATLGRHDEIRRLIAAAEPAAVRWGTPVVVAELQRARARASADSAERQRLLLAACSLLADSQAGVERDRTELILEGRQATAEVTRRGSGVTPGSTLVRAAATARRAPAGLSPRARAVVAMVASGMRNKEIAAALGITVSTVSRHVSAAMRATETASRTELALAAATWPTPGR